MFWDPDITYRLARQRQLDLQAAADRRRRAAAAPEPADPEPRAEMLDLRDWEPVMF